MASYRASTLLTIFVCALAVRWLYALAIYVTLGDAGLMGQDSVGFFKVMANFADDVVHGNVSGWGWLGPDLQLMPLYSWLLTISILAGGEFGAILYVLIQGTLDAGTCVLMYCLAGAIAPRYALPAAVAATLNPTQIVVSGLIYHDTPFVFFATLFLLASILWLRRPSWPLALVIGLALGGGATFRILVGPWLPIHFALLALGSILLGRMSWPAARQLAAAAAIACLCIAPVVLRNGFSYGAWTLTPQGGTHLATWVVPLVKEAADGTLWEKTAADMQRRVIERFGSTPSNQFEASRQQAILAREALGELGLAAIAKAWMNGIAVNLGSPAIALSPPVARLPRTGFYGTHGDSLPKKVFNYLFRSDNSLYAQLVLAGLIGVALIRLVQVVGLWTALHGSTDKFALAFLLLWACYVLAINGPIGSPKYRLPIEPILMVLTGAGWCALRDISRRPGSRL